MSTYRDLQDRATAHHALYQATGKRQYLDDAERLTAQADALLAATKAAPGSLHAEFTSLMRSTPAPARRPAGPRQARDFALKSVTDHALSIPVGGGAMTAGAVWIERRGGQLFANNMPVLRQAPARGDLLGPRVSIETRKGRHEVAASDLS